MLAQCLGRVVHHHHGIGRTRCPCRRVARRDRRAFSGSHPSFGSLASELVNHRIANAAMGVPAHCVTQRRHVERMEGQSHIQIVVVPGSCMNGLGPTHLFRRFAKELEPPLNVVLLHCSFGRQKARQSAHTQSRMRIRVAPGMRPQTRAGFLHRFCGLTISGNTVVFSIATNRGTVAIRPSGTIGCGHPTRALFHLKAFASQKLNIEVTAFVFTPRSFSKIPDRPCPIGNLVHPALHSCTCCCFGLIHVRLLLVFTPP